MYTKNSMRWNRVNIPFLENETVHQTEEAYGVYYKTIIVFYTRSIYVEAL